MLDSFIRNCQTIITCLALLLNTIGNYLPWSIDKARFGSFSPDEVPHLAQHQKLQLLQRIALHVILLNDLADLIPEPIFGIPDVVLLHHVLIVRAHLLHVQKFGLKIDQVIVPRFDCFKGFHADTTDFQGKIAHPLGVIVHDLSPLFDVEEH